MVNKSLDARFNEDWNKAVAWAQTQNIGAKDWLPVYQYDVNRMNTTGTMMSAAERNRAILAANNPNNVTPVPSDKPRPSSFLGNARTDLANIFTGLAPNHLIPNIFKTAETAIVHPQSWLHPLEDVGKGIASGNMADIKQGLKEAGSPNSILNWIPGVYDLSELAQGGPAAVLEHPITSFLDVAPFAPAGRILSLAASESRMGSIAAKLGMDVNSLYRASVPKMASSFILSRDVASIADDGTVVPRFPGIGTLTKNVLVGPVYGPDGRYLRAPDGTIQTQPLTFGGLFRQWGMNHSGFARSIAMTSAAAMDLENYGTQSHIYAEAPFQQAWSALNEDQKSQLIDVIGEKDPRRVGMTPAEVMRDMSIDDQVREAYDKYQDLDEFNRSSALASGGLVAQQGPWLELPNGQRFRTTEYFSANGAAGPVLNASRQLKRSMEAALKALGPAHKANMEFEQLAQVGGRILGQLDAARADAERVDLPGNLDPRIIRRNERGKALESVTVPLAGNQRLLFGPDGIIAQAIQAAERFERAAAEKGMTRTEKAPDYTTTKELAASALRRLRKSDLGSLDPRLHESFGRVVTELQHLKAWAEKSQATEERFLREAWGYVPKKKSRILPQRDPETHRIKNIKKVEERERYIEERNKVGKAMKALLRDKRRFENEWWNMPPDKWRGVLYDRFIAETLRKTDRARRSGELTSALRERGYADNRIDELLSDPTRLAEAIWHETNAAYSHPAFRQILSDEDLAEIVRDANEHVRQLREAGLDVGYVPVVSSLGLRPSGMYGTTLAPEARIRELSTTKSRNMTDFMPERYDLMARVHATTREAIERNIAIQFAYDHIAPMAMTAGDVALWIERAFPGELAGRDVRFQNLPDLVQTKITRQLGLVKWDPMGKMGFTFPRWENKAIYLPRGFANAIDQLLEPNTKRFPLEGAYEKGTKLFRFSILGLSPRYTAHIVFGGAFLLALRSDPSVVTKMGEAYRMVKGGTLPIRLRQRATEYGIEYQQPRDQALAAVNEAGGRQMGNMLVQKILGDQGILWSKASPAQWVKAAGELNLRFTNFVSAMYRAASYLDASDKAAKSTITLEDGAKVQMSASRARDEGIHHALKVMGDLKAMTPMERATFMRIMPFYGWTRHILSYVLSYPVDHPYRAQFLAVQANLNSDSVAKAIDKRMLFMFFLGSPDKSGNVKGIDVRFMDPLRDVANYASWSGWLGALNPVFEAGIAAIDPNLVYGSTSLYPNVTYNEFYGIETSATQGNPLITAAEQFTPQIGALDAALNISGSYRNLATRNPNQFAKVIAQSLNAPFLQLQDLNLKQQAVRGELARYRVAEQAASTAWAQPGMGGTGLEQALAGFSSVPDPRNHDYEVTPQTLQAIYNAYLAAYPGQNPADVAVAPATPPGY